MQSILVRYESCPIALRLLALSVAAIVFNGIYCLAYRYASGDPATFWEAFSWGAINLAPWLAAVEIGRNLTRASQVANVVVLAAFASLLLGSAAQWAMPDNFELVRRIPGMTLTLLTLGGIDLARRHRSRNEVKPGFSPASFTCDWVRAAGNYVELHLADHKPRLVRAGLQEFADNQSPPLLRIHRSYAVAPDSIAAVERSHVRLACGLRLPIGHRYREQLSA